VFILKLTSTIVFEIGTAVPYIKTPVITVARLIAEVFNNGIEGGLLYYAVCILPITTLPR
jgi:hypothetical protein